jgi:hypothetical protein
MPKLLAIVSTLTTLTVLATSGAAFAGGVRDHRHAATPPAANSPPAAAAKTKAETPIQRVVDRKVRQKQGTAEATKAYAARLGTGGSAPSGGKTAQQK